MSSYSCCGIPSELAKSHVVGHGVSESTELAKRDARRVEPSAVRAAYKTAESIEREVDLSEVDLRDVAWGKPMRLPPSYAGQRNYPGMFWSTTNREHVVYENLLELSWLWLADLDTTIVRLAAQPLRVIGHDGSRRRVRFPDFLAIDDSGRGLMVDVKPTELLAKPVVQSATRSRCRGPSLPAAASA